MGEVFAGRYELIEPIAAGGMGEVWTAHDRGENSVVAVKLLRQSDAGGLLRFMREQALRIHHPNVVTPLGWAGMDDRVLFSMPLVLGGSVSSLIGDYGPLPPRYTAELLRQLVDALHAVHAAGVVHRDVKPQNLLLDPTGTDKPRLRLTDFGIALPKDEPRLTRTALVIGTPGYLSPEQLLGADSSPAQDLYAVGVVGSVMLTGEKPPAEDFFTVTPPPDAQPLVLWDLLQRLTSAKPEERPSLEECARVLANPALAWVPQDEIEVFPHFRPDGRAIITSPDADPLAVRPKTTVPEQPNPGPAPQPPYRQQAAPQPLPHQVRPVVGPPQGFPQQNPQSRPPANNLNYAPQQPRPQYAPQQVQGAPQLQAQRSLQPQGQGSPQQIGNARFAASQQSPQPVAGSQSSPAPLAGSPASAAEKKASKRHKAIAPVIVIWLGLMLVLIAFGFVLLG